MSDSPPPTPDAARPDPDAVRDALRALATGAAPTETATFRDSVADATAAAECAVEAAAFLRAGRLPELARAVADAEAAGAAPTAARGRRALATLRRLDAAARSDPRESAGDANDGAPNAGTNGGARGDAQTPRNREADDDHFRRARGTVLPQTGQRPDR